MTKHELETQKLQAEIDHLKAEKSKFDIEAIKIHKDLRWYEITVIVAATLAIVAIARLTLM